MSKTRTMRRKGVLIAAVAAASAASLAQVASAATVTWNGGGLDGFWTTALNWNGGTPPTAGDALVFDGFGRLTSNSNNFADGTAFSGITFASSAGAFTLAGNQIDLTGNLVDDTSVLTQTINNNLIVAATRDVSVVDTGTLRLAGIISGAGGLHKIGAGTLVLAGANTYTSPTIIQAGRVNVSADNNLGAAPGAPTAAHLIINGTNGTLGVTNGFTLNANRGIALGPSSGAGNGVIDVATGQTLTYNGTMANNGAGTGGLVKTSFGNLTLGGASTYSGGTAVKNGQLLLNFAQAGAPVTNMINPASALTIGGATAGIGQNSNATLALTGLAGAANVQTFANTHVDLYGSHITTTPGTGGSVELNLGNITRTVGGTVVFAAGTANGSIKTTSANTNGILGGWAHAGTITVTRTIAWAPDYATVDGTGKIVAYNGYVNAPARVLGDPATTIHGSAAIAADPHKNVRLTAVAATPTLYQVNTNDANTVTDINTIAFDTDAANNTLGIGPGNTLRLGVYGGILKRNSGNNQLYVGGPGDVLVTGNGQGPNIGKLTAGGPVAGTPGEIVLSMPDANNNNGGMNILAQIVDNESTPGAGDGAVTLIKTGVMSVKIDGHNTHSGGTFINQGRFQLAGSEANAPNPDGLGTGRVTVAPGGYLFVSGVNSTTVQFTGPGAIAGGARLNTAQNAPVLNDMTLSGNGTNQEAGGSIRLGARSLLSGEITLAGDTRWCAGNGIVWLSTNADGTSPTGSAPYVDPGNAFTGKITGPGALDFGGRAVAGFNAVISNPANDWAGHTTILPVQAASLVRLGNNEVIPHGPGKGNLNFGDGANTAILDMQGFSETVNGLSTATSTNLAGAIVQNNGFNAVVTGEGQLRAWSFTPTTSTLTVGGFDQSATFGGTIRDHDAGAGNVTFPNPIYDGDATPEDPLTNVDLDGDAPTVLIPAPWITAGANVGLTKIGGGVQVLNGTNSYTGPTNVNGGTLAVNSSLNAASVVTVNNAGSSLAGTGTVGAVTVNTGGGLSPGLSGVGSIGNLTMSSLSMDSGDLKIDFGGTSDQVIVNGAANFTGANTITPSGAGVTGLYTVVTATGGITGANTFTLGAFPSIPDSRPTSGTVMPGANDIKVQITGAKVLTWTGNTNGNWEVGAGGPTNWVDPVPTAEKFFNADVANFNDGPTNRTITLNTTVQPGNVNFNNNGTNDYVIQGTGGIAGLNGVWKQGSANATIATNNTYTGQLRASAGRLTMAGSNAPGSVLVDGGTLVVSGSVNSSSTSLTAGELRIGDGGTTGSYTGPIANGNVVTLNRSDNFTLASAISGTGRVQQIGGGVVTMSGNSPYAGETTISNGTINVTNFAAIGGPSATVTVSQGGALDLAGIAGANAAGGFGTNKQIHISGTGVAGGGALTNTGTLAQQNAYQRIILDAPATIGGTGRYDLRGGTGGPSLTLQGHTLTKEGTNQFSIVGGQIDFGHIVVNGGIFAIETTTTNLDGGTITMNSGTTLQFFQYNQANADGIAQSIALNDATVSDANQTHATTLRVPIAMTGNNTFNIQASTGFNFSNNLTGTGGLTKSGNGVMILSGDNNSYSGTTTVNAGTLRTITGEVGDGKLGAPGGTVVNNATLQLYTPHTLGGVSGTGNTTIGDGTTSVAVDANHIRQNSLTIAGASSVKMAADVTAAGVSNVGTLSIAPGAKLDLNNTKLVTNSPVGSFNGVAYTGVQGEVQRAYNFGAWDMPGLTTSQLNAGFNAGILSGTETIAVATAEQVMFIGPTDTGVFQGQTVTGATTIAMYTYAGDLNFDGLVDGADYGVIDNYVQFPGTDGYVNGDFNYDGVIDGADYGVIDNTIQLQGAPFPGVVFGAASASSSGGGLAGVTAVPEPSACGFAILGAAALLGRRRRRQANNA